MLLLYSNIKTVVSLSYKNADSHININVEFSEGDGRIPIVNYPKKAEEGRYNKKVTKNI